MRKKPIAYILVGIPTSGKSTWAEKQEWIEDCAYISTDHHIEEYAKHIEKTYSDIFDEYMPTAINLMAADVLDAVKDGMDIVWDQTSTTIKSRKRKFRMLPGYYMIAVVFSIPDDNSIAKRLLTRPGKNISWDVIEKMKSQFVMPTKEEGFDEIWYT
jgi:predicted kinase